MKSPFLSHKAMILSTAETQAPDFGEEWNDIQNDVLLIELNIVMLAFKITVHINNTTSVWR